MGEVAEGLPLRDRAPTLSFTIGTIAAISRAIDTTRNLLGSVQDAVRFDQIFAQEGESISTDADEPEPTQSLLERTVDAIRRHLSGNGLKPSGAIAMTTRSDGSLRLETPSDQTAAIETSLAADSTIVQLAARLHARLGPTQLWLAGEGHRSAHSEASIVDLTPSAQAANIASEPGGYPNW